MDMFEKIRKNRIKNIPEFKENIRDNELSYSVTRNSFCIKKQTKTNSIYVIRCWDESEEFIKVGITDYEVRRRFGGHKALPYNYEVIFEHLCDVYFGLEIEKLVSLNFKSYLPLKSFGGKLECFLDEKIPDFVKFNLKIKLEEYGRE